MRYYKGYRPAAIVFFAAFLYSLQLCGQSLSNKVDSLKQAIKISKTDTDKIKLLLGLSEAFDRNDISHKISYADDALLIAKYIHWEKGMVAANRTLGMIYSNNINNYDSSIKYFQRCLSLSQNSGDKLNQAMALECIAIDYTYLTQYNKALDYSRQALQLNPDPDVEMGVLGDMGSIYNNVGDYPHALSCYDSSLKVLNELIRTSKKSSAGDTLQMAGLLITIGEVYIAMSQYDRALENYTKSLKLIEQTKKRSFVSFALMGIGKTYLCKKEPEKAIEYYTRALEECKQLSNKSYETQILNQLGNVYLETGETTKAMDYAQNALKLAEQYADSADLPAIYTSLGKIYTRQKNYSAAVSYLQKAVGLCEKTGALNGEKDAWEALSNTYEAMSAPAQALDAYRHFISLRDSIYNIGKANELTRIDLQSAYGRQQLADSLKQAGGYELKMQRQRVITWSGYTGLAVVLLLSFFMYRNYTQQKRANAIISKANDTIKNEKQLSENLLLNILPEDVARELKSHGDVQAKLFDHVTVLFTDFVNFTEAGERFSPRELVAELHTCFKAFDGIITRYNIEKIKTVGDAYLAVSGLPQANPGHAVEIVKAAIEMRDYMLARRQELGDKTFTMRIGINSGTVVAGIVGVKKFAYDIWGDTVNIAARMEQYGAAGKINISTATYELVKDEFTITDRGEVDAKNKGKMRMYFVEA
jgi:adenylate cyclase